jgi:hypothetical protein
MKVRLAVSLGTVTLALTVSGLATQVIGQSLAGYTAPRTPWGDPDIQGLFTTDDELGVLFRSAARHIASSMKQYFGDSRGHWEGDTLVVDVTNSQPTSSTTATPALDCTLSRSSGASARTLCATT